MKWSRWVWRGLLALVVLPVLAAVAYLAVDEAFRWQYYAAHPLAKAMHAASNRTGVQPAYGAVVLNLIPRGTRREEALATMEREGFHCGADKSPAVVRCHLSEDPSPLLYFMETDWTVELTFIGDALTAATGDHWLNAP
jgi:hypothetical protein